MISNAHRSYALAILTATYVFNFLDRQLLAILVVPIQTEFGASDTAMGLLYGLAFALFYATLAIPVARIADKRSRRNILAVAAGLWSAMTVLCGLAANFWQLLLLRIGVAVGEAGGVPPSQSLLNDYFPPEKRAMAMAVFQSGTFIGTILAMVGGALIAQNFGWRMAFVIVGAPGILLALVIRFTIKEPERGAWDKKDDAATAEQDSTSTFTVFKEMWAVSSLRYTLLGCGFASMAGYGLGYWTPTFMIRVHSLSLVQAGVMIGGIGAIAGLIGTIAGGKMCDVLSKKDSKWRLLLPAVSIALSLPVFVVFLNYSESSTFQIGSQVVPTALLFYVLASLVGSWWAAPTFVAIQELVAPGRRTLACAVVLLVMNLVGFGLGPLFVGVVSDALAPTYGTDSVRYALLAIMSTYVLAMIFYAMAGRSFGRERYS